jgi:hypothetical protein
VNYAHNAGRCGCGFPAHCIVAIENYGAGRRLLNAHLPPVLIGVRAALAPAVVPLAIYYPSHFALGCSLQLAFLSDVFDGSIARRLNVATPKRRRLDSLADSVFYLAALVAAWYLHSAALREHYAALFALAGIELGRDVFDLIKFGREASYHKCSSKLWGSCLFVGFFALLARDISGFAVAIAIYAGIAADLEGLAISVILPECKTDVPTFVHALRFRATRSREPQPGG